MTNTICSNQVIFYCDYQQLNQRFWFLKIRSHEVSGKDGIDDKLSGANPRRFANLIDVMSQQQFNGQKVIIASRYADWHSSTAYFLINAKILKGTQDTDHISKQDFIEFLQAWATDLHMDTLLFEWVMATQTPQIGTFANDIIHGQDLFQLLINGLGYDECTHTAFNNIGGNLVCLPKTLKIAKNKSFQAYHITLSKQMVLKIATVTYRPRQQVLLEVQHDKQRLSKIMARPSYQLSTHILKPVHYPQTDISGDADFTKCLYIRCGLPNTKATADAIDFSDLAKLEQTRLFMLQQIIDRFNQMYANICQVSWSILDVDKSIKNNDRFRLIPKNARSFRNSIAPFIQNHPIAIVDKINDDLGISQKLALNIKNQFISTPTTLTDDGDNIDLSVVLTEKEILGAYNICLVKPEIYYQTNKNMPDPYKIDGKFLRQHITDETYQTSICFKNKDDDKTRTKKLQKQNAIRQNILKTAMAQLFIKAGLHQQQIFMPKNTLLNGKLAFILRLQRNDELQYAVLTVNSAGLIEMDCLNCIQIDGGSSWCDLLQSVHNYAQSCFASGVMTKTDLQYFVAKLDDNGNVLDINMVYKDGTALMPNVSLLNQQLTEVASSLPADLQKPANLVEFLIDACASMMAQDGRWCTLLDLLTALPYVESKKQLLKILNQVYAPKSKESAIIKQALMTKGVVLNASRSIANLQKVAQGAYSLSCGTYSACDGWYGVGFYLPAHQSQPTMIPLYKVRALHGSLLTEQLLSFIDVDFIRWNQPSSQPYPIKYLQEYIATLG